MPRQVTPGFRLPVVTSLPASPLDGQEVIYRFVQNLQIVNVQPADPQVLNWRLRYDAAVGKWIPVGQQEPIMAFDSGQRSQSFGAGWSQFTGAALSLGTPVGGVYRFKFGANFLYNNAISNNEVGLYDGPTATWGANGLYCYGANHNVAYGCAHGSAKRPAFTGAGGFTWGVFPSAAGTVTAAGLYIEAYPVQIG